MTLDWTQLFPGTGGRSLVLNSTVLRSILLLEAAVVTPDGTSSDLGLTSSASQIRPCAWNCGFSSSEFATVTAHALTCGRRPVPCPVDYCDRNVCLWSDLCPKSHSIRDAWGRALQKHLLDTGPSGCVGRLPCPLSRCVDSSLNGLEVTATLPVRQLMDHVWRHDMVTQQLTHLVNRLGGSAHRTRRVVENSRVMGSATLEKVLRATATLSSLLVTPSEAPREASEWNHALEATPDDLPCLEVEPLRI
jgi:hypothetical protein